MNAFTDKGIDPPTFLLPDVDTDNSMPPTEADYWDAEHLLTEKVRLTTEAIKALPPMYKRFMEERFLNKKSYNDILDIMKYHEKDINLQTVKNRIFRGRRIVKKQLESMKIFTNA
jgi:DNA-directed RNA polymerase specialized sigma24 family protein